MPLRVVVLFQRSLFASGIASRLRELPHLMDVQTIDAGRDDALALLSEANPAVVLLDTFDVGAAERLPVTKLVEMLPGVKILLLDPESDQARVLSSARRSAQGIDELIALLQGFIA